MEDITEYNTFYGTYRYLIHDLTEPRAAHLPLIMRPFTMIAFLLVYNFGCLKWGPKFMEKREPFKLKNLIIAFDICQIFFNAYLFYKTLQLGWLGHYNFFCGALDTEDNPHTREIALMCYGYFLIKMSDLLDTVFMVLRKKNRHISFLHMYHHTGMVILAFVNTKYMPGGHHTCLAIYNTFVHVIMYTYYLCAALYPDKNMYSFKKLVTKLQMIQFGLIGVHLSSVLVVPDCSYPKWPLALLIPNNLLMFLLFYDFYRNTYVLKKPLKDQPSKRPSSSAVKSD